MKEQIVKLIVNEYDDALQAYWERTHDFLTRELSLKEFLEELRIKYNL